MTLYQGKYRAESNRMPKWDYSSNGIYFIILVLNKRVCWFGEIIDNKMVYSNFGLIVIDEWNKSFRIRKELFQDEFQLMPNHLHAIVNIKEDLNVVETQGLAFPREQQRGLHEETQSLASLRDMNKTELSSDGKTVLKRKPKSLSTFVAGFKNAATNKIDDFIDNNHLGLEKFNRHNRLWQVNYHDHIIRNETEYWKIKNYIRNNPKNWHNDKFIN